MNRSILLFLITVTALLIVGLIGSGLTLLGPDTSSIPAQTSHPEPRPEGSRPMVPTEETAPRQEEDPMPDATVEPDPEQFTEVADRGRQVEDLMARMTLEEKVGQLFLVFFEGPALSPALEEMLVEYHVGGIVLFQITDNVQSPRQVATLINEAQSMVMRGSSEHGASIPLLVAVDQEGGPVVRLTDGFTVFPSQMAVGATASTEMATRMAEVMAVEMQAVGINMVLGPVVDVNNNPDNPVIGVRSFGSSPQIVTELGTAMIQAYARQGLLATAKHFPGHGDTDVDSHFGLPVLPHGRDRLESIELAPFRAAISTGVPAVMTAHLLLPAIDPDNPATLSSVVLTDLLRTSLAFDGLIVSDSLGMGALKRQYSSAEIAEQAFRAGADLLAFGADVGATVEDQKEAYARILDLVKSGEISEERLDSSVRRILRAKAEHNLLDWQPLDVDALSQQVNTPVHQAVAQQVAGQSITLVKDDVNRIPVSEEGQMLLVWPADLPVLGEQLASCRENVLLRPVPRDPTSTDIEQIGADARRASIVVIATANARRHPSQLALVEALSGTSPIVAALEQPYDLLAFPQIDTYLASYGSSDVSLNALAGVLCGQQVPQGQLPVELSGFP